MSDQNLQEQIQSNELKGFDVVLGLRYTAASPDSVTAEFTLRPELHQPWGITHGGVYCSVIESVASVSGQLWIGSRGIAGHVVGVNNNTDFLRAVSEGELTAVSTPIHRGRRQQLWLVEITGADGKTVARGQVRLQNIED
ncbi:PaaI family thioesterase [Tsukamurella sp. 8F]|uniref:PaaI family thioesterase n=1 Tax=unclassified Tsukamurella TaxID=2633480 RepID=UPI0023B8F367|nr:MULTISPECIES: PaaI family thioesterase [unclassified Tsukamurella]MDF0529100.1 PaaI family thioesterase [Tsukamurella sp. 8J]MDF0589023.1 PaaI family thioesterase [Tsukamurella sp. 8F]